MKEDMAKKTQKIVFLGPASTGKTSTKLYFFADNDSEHLINHSQEPTRGIEWTVYYKDGNEIGVLDTSGQELKYIIDNDEIFMDADSVIFQFDITDFQEIDRRESILKHLIRIVKKKTMEGSTYNFFILAHMIDLIYPQYLDEVKEDVINMIGQSIDLVTFNGFFKQHVKLEFTSLKEPFLGDTVSILMNIIGEHETSVIFTAI